jgi:Uma2 family endonuclease
LAPLDVVLDEQTVVQPDIFFVSRGSTQCHLGADDRWYGAPDLCIEILSADIRHDRVKKMALYAQFGVGEYWIVDPVGRYVEIHRLEATSGRLVLHSDFADGEMLSTPSLPGLQIPLGEVFPPKE